MNQKIGRRKGNGVQKTRKDRILTNPGNELIGRVNLLSGGLGVLGRWFWAEDERGKAAKSGGAPPDPIIFQSACFELKIVDKARAL